MKREEAAILTVILVVVALLAVDAIRRIPPIQGGGGSSGGEKAPDFHLRDINGHEFSLSDFRGKVVILDFFMIRCAPCRTQVGELKEVLREFGGQVVIISISVDPSDTDEDLKEYARENGITWIVARDTADVASKYGIKVVPTLFIIDEDGYIRYSHEGATGSDVLSREVEEILES